MSTTELTAGRYGDLDVLDLGKDEQRECHWWGCGTRARFSIKPYGRCGFGGSAETVLCATHAKDQIDRMFAGWARGS